MTNFAAVSRYYFDSAKLVAIFKLNKTLQKRNPLTFR